jgi:hypothetical protein
LAEIEGRRRCDSAIFILFIILILLVLFEDDFLF